MRTLPSFLGGVREGYGRNGYRREGHGHRIFAITTVGALHVAGLCLLLATGSIDPHVVHGALTIIDLPMAQASSPSAPSAPTEPKADVVVRDPAPMDVPDLPPLALLPMPSILASATAMPEPVLAMPSPAVMAMLDAADGAATGGSCDLTEPVQAALRTSADVQAALPQIPRASRSVANAIMVWNIQWIGRDGQHTPLATPAVRDVIAATIAAATPECRMQTQAGPRLLTLPGTAETTVLALGSGTWRWQDLLNTAFPDGAVDDNGRPIDVVPQFTSRRYASY